MQNQFLKATTPFDREHIIESRTAPFKDFKLPDFLPVFCDEFLKGVGESFPIEQILLFGGSITDQKLGVKTKDYDIYIASPAISEAVQEILSRGKGSRALREIEEDILGNSPLMLHEESLSFRPGMSLLEGAFGVNGLFQDVNGAYRMDIIMGSKIISPAEFSRNLLAPTLSTVVSLHPGEIAYAYHKDAPEQIESRVLCTDDQSNPKVIEKAIRKGFEIVTPASWVMRLAH